MVVSGDRDVAIGNGLANLIIAQGSDPMTLDGGGGDDVLVGNSGADTFVMARGYGHEVVYNFNPATDLIRLEDFNINSFATLQSDMSQVGNDTVITLDPNDSVILRNTEVSELSSSDFELPLNTSEMRETFDDAFRTFTSSPNGSSGWMTTFWWDQGNINSRTLTDQVQYYSDSSVGVDPFSIGSGGLTITAAPATPGDGTPAGSDLTYTSGLMTTYKLFSQLYGYFQITAKLPTGTGFGSAFWMLPTDGAQLSELDVMEELGSSPSTIYETSHHVQGTSNVQTGFVTDVPTASTGFNTYGVDWEKDTITWYIDGVAVASAPTPADMDVPMYMLINLGVGAPGSWGGAANGTSSAAMDIQSVEVFAPREVNAPFTTSSTYSVVAGHSLTVNAANGVLANDLDENALTLSAVLAKNGGPSHGTLALSANGSFVYTPNAGFAGTDTFTYIASDSLSQSAATTVSIDVAAHPPAVSAKMALSMHSGESVAIVDTASDIEALTSAQFAALAGLGVVSLTATDTGLALTEAEAVSLESGGIPVAVPSGATAIVSDTASNLANLTASQISGLAATGFSGMASTSLTVTLSVAQALALEGLGWTIAIPTGGSRRVSDAAAAIAGLSAAEIAGLAAIGFTSVTATGTEATLSVAQAQAFETAGLTLSAPSGMSNAIADTATDVETLTAQQIAGLSKLHVTSVSATNAGLTLSAGQAGALASAKITLSVPSGDSVAIVDTASDIEALTAAQFAGLAGLGVRSISADDASLALTEAAAADLESGGIPVAVPSGAKAIVSDTASNLAKFTATQISGLTGIGVTELYATNANVGFSVAQTSAIQASDIAVAAAGSYTVTENFADGVYWTYEGGALITEKSVNTDGSYDISHFDVSGLGYSSYEDLYTASGALLAESRDMSDGSGALLIYANGQTVRSGSGLLSETNGNDTFALTSHTTEAITANGHTSEVFAYDAGFGSSAITGFAATGSTHDILQVQSAMFSNATVLLNDAVQMASNVVITDPTGDTITLNNVNKTTLAANTADLRFM
jgi:beta-glucanase (GH16 family)